LENCRLKTKAEIILSQQVNFMPELAFFKQNEVLIC